MKTQETINKMDKLTYDTCVGFHKMVIFVLVLLAIPLMWNDAKFIIELLIEKIQ